MPRQITGYIDEDDCIGDSLGPTGGGNKGFINTNYLILDEAVQSLSAYDESLRPAITPSGNNLTVTNSLTATNSITALSNIQANNNITALNEVRTNIIRGTTGTTHFINGYPRQPGQIIEYLSSPCDGSSVTVGSGTYTFQNVQTWPGIYTTSTDIDGSLITYTPPPGTTRVIYRFNFGMWWGDPHAISHLRFFVGANEVIWARHNRSGYYPEEKYAFEWPIAIGGTPNTNSGRLASWTTPILLKMQWRAYSSGNRRQPHVTNYWDGVGSNQLIMPTLTLIAIA